MRFPCVAAVAALLGVAGASNAFSSFKRVLAAAPEPRTLAAGAWDENVVPSDCAFAIADVGTCWANSAPPSGPSSPPQGADCCDIVTAFYQACGASGGGEYQAIAFLLQVNPGSMSPAWLKGVWDLTGRCPSGPATSATCAAAVGHVDEDCNSAGVRPNADSGSDSDSGAAPAHSCCDAVQAVVPNCLGTPQFQADNFLESILASSTTSAACQMFPAYMCAAAVLGTARCVNANMGNLSNCCEEEGRMAMFCVNHDLSVVAPATLPATIYSILTSAEFTSMCVSSGGASGNCDPAAVIPGLFWYHGQLVTNNIMRGDVSIMPPFVDRENQVFYHVNPAMLPVTASGAMSGYGHSGPSCAPTPTPSV